MFSVRVFVVFVVLLSTQLTHALDFLGAFRSDDLVFLDGPMGSELGVGALDVDASSYPSRRKLVEINKVNFGEVSRLPTLSKVGFITGVPLVAVGLGLLLTGRPLRHGRPAPVRDNFMGWVPTVGGLVLTGVGFLGGWDILFP